MINIYSIGKRLTRLPVSMMAASFRVMPRVKYWEIIADNLSKAGWSWGCISTVNFNGQTIFVVDTHRGDGKRFVVMEDEILTALS